MDRIRALAAVAALFSFSWLSVARAADAGVSADAGASCVDSRDCARPTPYCAAHRCVECVGDRNCATGVCDVATGTCRACVSDGDCGGSTPYCETTQGSCVECLSTRNCGGGVQCEMNHCGHCGDGICGENEAISTSGGQLFPFQPSMPDPRTTCLEDCGKLCPAADLGSLLGKHEFSTAGARNLFSSDCGGVAGPDVSFSWTAPKDGNFAFFVTGQLPGAEAGTYFGLSVSFRAGDCSGLDQGCSQGGGFTQTVSKGDQLVIVIDTEDPAPVDLTLEISYQGSCSGLFCGPPPVGGGDASTSPNDQGKALCLSNAQDRGETICGGTECACTHCPRDYDDTGVVPGATAIRDCMNEKNCVGADCYNSGACRTVIDSNQGISGPAFRAAAALQSCALTFACALPCESEGGAAPPPFTDAGVEDAGRLCAPGRVIGCACDNGYSGLKTCDAAGQGFGACDCSGNVPGPLHTTDGCGCRIEGAKVGGAGHAASFMALSAAVAILLRRGSRPNRGARKS